MYVYMKVYVRVFMPVDADPTVLILEVVIVYNSDLNSTN